ncbi:receptor-type tyrosine-protein phosphatase eta [Mauremys mutica]|uniref:receptor-type tyrosine-protein phosphatase eta n=1 Tax=Mauremys mutica TaxID=74926 RepID=UPI001D166384|nr:receptor-type tyrosine-protein phosphatase eta [Mauremys mutica]
MKQPGQLFLRLLLLLCLAKIKPAAACFEDCSSVNVNAATTEIHIDTLPDNFTIISVTFANGTLFPNSSLNNSIGGLSPGVQYIINFQNGTEACCKNITTKSSPVSDIQATNIGTEHVTLTWENNDTAAPNYTYVISTDGNGISPTQNQTSQNKNAVIGRLQPGTLYNFTVVPLAADNMTKGDPKVKHIYTKPSPVSDIQATNVSTEQVTLTWKNNDTAAPNYTYVISTDGNGISPTRNQTSQNKTAVIRGLQPGTLYNFTIVPLAADNMTEGDPKVIHIYTKPSPVSDIQATNIGTEQVTLTWKNNDTAAPNYTYVIYTDGNGISPTRNQTSQNKTAVIRGLQPGTLYNFTIVPLAADNMTKGDPEFKHIYTKPSPVSDIQATNIGTEQVTLTWKNNDTAAPNYTYVIYTDGNGISPTRNQTSQNKTAVIRGLQPGTLYNFTIVPLAADNMTEGDPKVIHIYTKPSPVSDIQATNIGTEQVTLTWENNDTASPNYTYVIYTDGNGISRTRNQTSQNKTAVIRGLQPGTLYNFTIVPLAADNMTEGDPKVIHIYTKPSVVSNLKVINVSTTEVTLTWQNSDAEASKYTYRILYKDDGTSVQQNITSQTMNATLTGLKPGTLYLFKVFSRVSGTEGDSNPTNTYTKPSPVSDIQATNIGTEQVTLTWENNDTAASNYTYVIYTDGNGISATRNQTFQNKNVVIGGLWPGTPYNFTIVPLAADNMTEGDPKVIHICTEAAPVLSFNCTPVTKEPKLTLKWELPAGDSTNFSINTFNDAWSNKTLVLAGSLETTVTNLNYSTSYNVSIITCSCGKDSLPKETTCDTSITDPPAPIEKPIITSITHNSFKIKFSGFESKNGPLKAYAIVITTTKEGNIPANSSLNYTYNDFKENKRKTYITSVITATQMRAFSSRSDSSQYEMEVGDASKSHAYSNGPLEPLGSYRASVAGFTKIEFNNGELIVEERSYVSFTPYSQAITLLQDPGVITGAVVGCIVGAVAIAAVVVLVFWRRRRKDGKNSELPFSPIRPKKSKSIKVENFESYFKKQQADSNCGFAEEYEELRSVGINQPKFAAELTENRGKNRYNNVLPYDISRVKLSIQNHPTDDYINANYMPGYNSKKEFIAAQGPLPNTVQDFWRMIWEKNIYAIVMLTKCVEQGRTKCEEYWPDKGSNYYDDITVTLVSEYVLPEWTIRDFTVEGSDATESHSVRQFHFTSWPDHGVPETTDLLINFRHLVQENIRQNPPDSPTLVHCSAGVGRTGTFIAIDHLIQQIEMENASDVYGVVYDLRMHRPLMVQTEDQYVFLNQCVLDIIKSQRNKKSDLIYQNTTAMAIYENFGPTAGFEKANGYHA